MAHKINPLIFRSKLFPFYTNIWKNNFKKNIKILNNCGFLNDILEIKLISFYKNKKNLNIILIKDNINLLKYLKLIYIEKNIYLNFYNLKYPYSSPSFILNLIIKNFTKKKGSLRKIIKDIMLEIYSKTKNIYKLYGIKIIISGRINGIQKTKIETFKYNLISLHTLNFYIKHNMKILKTKYGIFSFKIWLFFK